METVYREAGVEEKNRALSVVLNGHETPRVSVSGHRLEILSSA